MAASKNAGVLFYRKGRPGTFIKGAVGVEELGTDVFKALSSQPDDLQQAVAAIQSSLLVSSLGQSEALQQLQDDVQGIRGGLLSSLVSSGPGLSVGTVLDYLGRTSLLQGTIWVNRCRSNPHFFVWAELESGDDGFADPDFAELSGVDPSQKPAGTTELAWCQAHAPNWTWAQSAFVIGGLVYGTRIMPSGTTAEAIYSPLGGYIDLAAIKRLWDYTPASGPPERNGIDDAMTIYSLLPVQF